MTDLNSHPGGPSNSIIDKYSDWLTDWLMTEIFSNYFPSRNSWDYSAKNLTNCHIQFIFLNHKHRYQKLKWQTSFLTKNLDWDSRLHIYTKNFSWLLRGPCEHGGSRVNSIDIPLVCHSDNSGQICWLVISQIILTPSQCFLFTSLVIFSNKLGLGTNTSCHGRARI